MTFLGTKLTFKLPAMYFNAAETTELSDAIRVTIEFIDLFTRFI